MLKKIHDLLINWDHTAWYYLNTQWHCAFLDAIVPFLRNQYFWSPLYFFLLIFVPYKFGRRGWLWCFAFLIAFALSDQISVNVIKPFFHRVRPCNNPYLANVIHLIVECGSGLSFPSAHAANHFSMGVFSAVTLGRIAKWVWPVALTWAILVSFAQVYVGVHYPLDVTCGGLLGVVIGLTVGKIFNYYAPLQ
jgi:membrane-associated phospholipid phosphatase